jgi:hypothetical protein
MRMGATTMRDDYDFSQGQRGKFFRKDAVLDLPVYLDAEVRDYLSARAKAKGVNLGKLVNELLKRDIELIEVAK